MRVLVENYGDCRIFSDRPFGYKRYHVEWNDGSKQTYSSLWYSLNQVKKNVEERLNDTV
jgi:hypothetical protein